MAGFSIGGDSAVGAMAGGAVLGPVGMAAGGSLGGQAINNILAGTGQNPGWLGVGQYQYSPYNINEKPFTDNSQLDALRAAFANAEVGAEGRAAPLIGSASTVQGQQLDLNQANQVRAQQMALAQALQNQAAGTGGPSVAQLQLQQGMDRNLQAAIAQQASARGGAGGGLALRNIANQRNQMNADFNQQAALLRAQEMQTAQNQLGSVLGGIRSTDVGTAAQNAAFAQQAGLANQAAVNEVNARNQAAQMNQQQSNDAMARFYNQAQMGMLSQAQQNQQDLERLKAQQSMAANQAQASAYESAAKNRAGFIGGLGQGIGSFAAMSDEDEKKDIEDGNDPLKAFLKGFATPMKNPNETEFQSEGKGLASAFGSLSKFMKPSEEDKGMAYAGPDKVPMLSPLESGPLPAYKGGMVCGYDEGGIIPGEAEVDGDSPKNDKVPIMASPGEAVIPRSAMQDPKKLQEFVDALKAHQYKYKDPKNGDGTYISPMAQELEKSELGKHMVMDTPQGKMVDYSRAGGVMLATAGMLNKRMDDLEKAFKARVK